MRQEASSGSAGGPSLRPPSPGASLDLPSFSAPRVDAAPPPKLAASPPLSTLNEVSSNPPFPETPPSTVFPQLVVSPPLSCPNTSEASRGAKPLNGLGTAPSEERLR